MRRCYLLSRPILAVVVAALVEVAPVRGGAHGSQENMLVNTAWLQEHSHDKDLIVLAVGKKDEYASRHIPGSGYLDFADVHTITPPAGSSALILEVPPQEQVRAALVKAGVRDGSRIILYSTGDNATLTARVYLTLDAMGLGG